MQLDQLLPENLLWRRRLRHGGLQCHRRRYSRLLRVSTDGIAAPAKAVCPSSAAIEPAKRRCECMAVRAKQRQVTQFIVLPITIDVFDLDRNFARLLMTLSPSTASALFAKTTDQVPPQKRRGTLNAMIGTGFEKLDAESEMVPLLAAERTELSCAFLDCVPAAVPAPAPKLLCIHAFMLKHRCAIRLA
jgi:hypothetical protein